MNAKKLAIERAKKAAQAAKKKAADKVNTISNKASNATKKTGNSVQKDAQARGNPGGSSAPRRKEQPKPADKAGASDRNDGGSSGDQDGDGGSCPVSNSFLPGTKVLMADGSAKAIEDVKPGDKIKAADPETGETRTHTVTAKIAGDGVKQLVKVTVDTDGDQGDETEAITATDGHPFWVPELEAWIDATDLAAGDWLQTGAGTRVQITAIERWKTPRALVHNLTVGDVHTYFVVAGSQSVLVHNCTQAVANDLQKEAYNGKTVGQAVSIDANGNATKPGGSLTSGVSDMSRQTAAELRTMGITDPKGGDHPAAEHPDTQFALLLRNNTSGVMHADIVITKAGGPCMGPLSCDSVIGKILREGQSLTVHFPLEAGGMSWRRYDGIG